MIVSGAGGNELRGLGEQHGAVRAAEAGMRMVTELTRRRGAADIRQLDVTGKMYDRKTIACREDQ